MTRKICPLPSLVRSQPLLVFGVGRYVLFAHHLRYRTAWFQVRECRASGLPSSGLFPRCWTSRSSTRLKRPSTTNRTSFRPPSVQGAYTPRSLYTFFSLHCSTRLTRMADEPDNNSEHCNDFVLEGSPFVVALNNAYVDYDGALSSSLFL